MIKLKIGRYICEIKEDDLIFDNGVCYQIITQKVGTDKSYPIMSKKLFNDLKKTGLIFTNDRLKLAAMNKYNDACFIFWKFDISRMERLGY